MQEKDNCIEIHDRAEKIVTNQYPSKLKRLVELPDVRWQKDHNQVETYNQGTATATKRHQHNLNPLCKKNSIIIRELAKLVLTHVHVHCHFASPQHVNRPLPDNLGFIVRMREEFGGLHGHNDTGP
jgi:hypothetical protein